MTIKEEMINRMRVSVEKIAAEYGNPTFTRIFTNDNIRARMLRQRMHLLNNLDALNTEIGILTRQKEEIGRQVDDSRRTVTSLREEAKLLGDRLQAARVALELRPYSTTTTAATP
jgi:hypothetical protein